ncbi:MAG: ABC transporter permease, partial [Pseudomonadota bacterium]
LGGATRGVLCAFAVGVIVLPVVGVGVMQPFWLLWFVLSGSMMLSLMGLLAAIYAEKFDQTAAITNFLITPLSFLSGTFYSISVLPEVFQGLSRWNPFFYLIDGARYGTLGISDASPVIGFWVTLVVNIALAGLAWRWLSRGYRLKT